MLSSKCTIGVILYHFGCQLSFKGLCIFGEASNDILTNVLGNMSLITRSRHVGY